VRGSGQATSTAFSVPEGSLGWWVERLERFGVPRDEPLERFDEEVLTFLDPDGLKLELVAHADAGEPSAWGEGPVPPERSIRGFHSVALTLDAATRTADLLTEGLGLTAEAESRGRSRFRGTAPVGSRVDLIDSPGTSRGRVAAGTVHHVAFRVANEEEQLAWRDRLIGAGLGVTPVQDRRYFRSIYFREPGGVLFEIATDPPGFTADETVEELGSSLKLPPWLEPHRGGIEAALPPIEEGPGADGEEVAS
jgi:glyoxalase family protein